MAKILLGCSLAALVSADLKCDLCEDVAKVALGKTVEECEALCQKAGAFDSACDELCKLVQQDVSADVVCAKVGLCPKDISNNVTIGGCPTNYDLKNHHTCMDFPKACYGSCCIVQRNWCHDDAQCCKDRGCRPSVSDESVKGDCISDLLKIAQDAAPAAEAIKGLVTDCHGDDRSKCQADVNLLLQSLTNAVNDVSGCTTSCGSHGPQCVAEIKKLSDKINAISDPAKQMADKCAGADKSTIECVLDGVKVGADVAAVAGEVAAVVKVCKAGDGIVV